jgi:hypothetical protein
MTSKKVTAYTSDFDKNGNTVLCAEILHILP